MRNKAWFVNKADCKMLIPNSSFLIPNFFPLPFAPFALESQRKKA